MSQSGTERTQDEAGEGATKCRALAVIESGAHGSRGEPARRPDAAFLAQIMASRAHMGEFRRYRRSEPAIATAQYRAAAALIDGPRGLRLSA
jgi:hypothetical protein